jgi:hypothetical protein
MPVHTSTDNGLTDQPWIGRPEATLFRLLSYSVSDIRLR